MGMTIELFFQVFNTILLISIPICIYVFINRFVLHRKSIDKRLSDIAKN